MDIYEKLHKCGIIPVIKLEDADKSEALATALLDGGLDVAEVTFRTTSAPEVIRRISSSFPNMTVGAGTVLSVGQAEEAIACGASFIVSPGFNPKVVKWCLDHGVTIIPGIATPTELEAAMEMGLNVVKFFPAEAFGGLKTLKAISAPYGNIRFMPTGGISLDNLDRYLGFSKIIACGGSFMVTGDLIKNGDFSAITSISKKAAEIVAAHR